MADEHLDCGSPIAYLVLRSGTAVYASGNEQIGTVDRVLFVQEEDVFDGIVIHTSDCASSTRIRWAASTSAAS
jgi:hypothetical protein